MSLLRIILSNLCALTQSLQSVTSPIVTTLIPQLQAQMPPSLVESQSNRRRAIDSDPSSKTRRQSYLGKVNRNNSGTGSAESTSISSEGSADNLPTTPSPPISLSPPDALTCLPNSNIEHNELKSFVHSNVGRHTCTQQCFHADAGPSTSGPSTRESSPLRDPLKRAWAAKRKKFRKDASDLGVESEDASFGTGSSPPHDLTPINELEIDQAREGRERRRHSGIFSALRRKSRSKSTPKLELGRSSSVPAPCSPTPTHSSLPQDVESCSTSISSEGARSSGKRLNFNCKILQLMLSIDLFIYFLFSSVPRLKRRGESKKVTQGSESETLASLSDMGDHQSMEGKETINEPVRGRRSLCLSRIHTGHKEGKLKEPPRRTQPYEAPYFFPTPYSPEVEGYVARTRNSFRRGPNPQSPPPAPFTPLNPPSPPDDSRRSGEISLEQPHSAPSHRVEFVVPDKTNSHKKSASIGSINEFGVKISPLRMTSSTSRSPKRASTLPSPSPPIAERRDKPTRPVPRHGISA